MNSEIIITAMNAKISNLMGVGGFGGLKPEQIAQALSGISEGAYNLAYAMHGDEDSRKLLLADLMRAVVDDVSKETLEIICQIAIHEEIGDSPCLECGGRGFVYRTINHPDEAKEVDDNGMLTIPCTAAGCVDGNYRMTGSERGQLIAEATDQEYTRYKWANGWSWEYSAALSQLADWGNELDRHLSRRLNDD